MARTKKTCDYNCFNCKFKDCVISQKDISVIEKLESNMRDNACNTYGTIAPARQQRKTRGRRL